MQAMTRKMALLCLIGSSALAAAEVHTVQASAEATVQATPDRAEVMIGITTAAADAAAAGSQNAGLTQQVMQALGSLIGGSGSYKTVGYSVQPQYQYMQGGAAKLKGYEATDTLRVTLDDLSLSGKVIDAALRAGATNVGGISFTLRDPSVVTEQVLAQAAAKARSSAEAIARALHLHVTGVISAETGQPGFAPRPMSLVSSRASEAVSTPVNPGTLDVSASVTVVLAVE